MRDDGNPKLPGGLRIFSAAVIVVLLVGAGLFFVPDMVKPRWPWLLAPFNARFLGSFYLAEMVAMVALLVWNRWSPARMILVMAFVFTLMVSVTSLINLDHFNFGRKASWLWFAVYAGSAVVSGLFLWNARGTPPVNAAISGAGWRRYFQLETILLGLYGLGLLILPATFSAFWPWKIDAFHAQTYSAIFITAAAGTWLISSHAPREELVALGAAQLALGLLSAIGLALTDAAVKRVDWAAPGAWAWLALFALIAATGLVKLLAGLGRARAPAFARHMKKAAEAASFEWVGSAAYSAAAAFFSAASCAAFSAASASTAAIFSASSFAFSAFSASRSASFSLRARTPVFSEMRADLPRRSRR